MDPINSISFPKYLVLDGGLGTTLTERCGNNYADMMWTMRYTQSQGSVVKDTQREFLEAGADVIMTNTYSPSVQTVMETLCLDKEQAMELFRNEARNARSVRDQFWCEVKDKQTGRPRPLVVAAMGPSAAGTASGTDYSGAYTDNTSIHDMAECFKDKIQAMLDGGVDLLGFETIPAVKEAEAIYLAMKDFPAAKAWITFCCKDGTHIGNGETFKEAAMTSLTSDVIVGVGVNCSEPSYITSLLKEIPNAVKKRKLIVVYPNAGKCWDSDALLWREGTDSKPLHQYVSNWLTLGANWIGGCCLIPPEEIMKIRREFDTHILRK